MKKDKAMIKTILHRSFLVPTCFVLTLGCSKPPQMPASASESNSTPGEIKLIGSAPTEIIPPTDASLKSDDYVASGLPPIDRKWSGDDMARAVEALVGIAQKNAAHLPRYGSPLSGKAFERLTSDDNLASYRNRALPLDRRLPDALQLMESSNEILKIYIAAFSRRAVGDSELVELAGAQLRIGAVMIQLVGEFIPTLDQNDPTYAVRMDGLRQMKGGMAKVVTGNLITLTESRNYRTSELKRLVGYMQNSIPVILPELSEESRAEALKRIRSYLDDPKMEQLKPELKSLLSLSESAAKVESAPTK